MTRKRGKVPVVQPGRAGGGHSAGRGSLVLTCRVCKIRS